MFTITLQSTFLLISKIEKLRCLGGSVLSIQLFGFSWDHDLAVVQSSPKAGSVLSMESASDSLSLSLPGHFLFVSHQSINQSINL